MKHVYSIQFSPVNIIHVNFKEGEYYFELYQNEKQTYLGSLDSKYKFFATPVEIVYKQQEGHIYDIAYNYSFAVNKNNPEHIDKISREIMNHMMYLDREKRHYISGYEEDDEDDESEPVGFTDIELIAFYSLQYLLKIPEELIEAFDISRDAIFQKQKIIEAANKIQKRKNNYIKKYGSWQEKVLSYIKT